MFVACATSSASAQAVQGNPQAGAGKVAMCIGCHGIAGYQASFPEVHKVPKISGQSAAYIASALEAYRKGDRSHPSMRAVAQSLSDQDIADVAAYYQAHTTPSASPAQPHDPPAQVAAYEQHYAPQDVRLASMWAMPEGGVWLDHEQLPRKPLELGVQALKMC